MTPDNPSLPFDSATGSPAGPPLAAPERRKGVVWKWSIATTAVVLAFLMWQCGTAIRAGRKLSNAAVQRFHKQLNGTEYGPIVDDADEGFRHSGTTREELMRFLQVVHTNLGNAGESNLRNITVQATPGNTFVITVYQTKFDRGEAIERFTWMKTNGELFLYRYNIQSNALIMWTDSSGRMHISVDFK
ncbi:MAG TPA: hypothetical protein VNX88_13745 [Terriglobales bacterium]|jgi:hypothetical protein|nr:hypothetical protein [Terriglobales bacterium]